MRTFFVAASLRCFRLLRKPGIYCALGPLERGVVLIATALVSLFLCAPWATVDDIHHECVLQQDFPHRVLDVTMFGKALHPLL